MTLGDESGSYQSILEFTKTFGVYGNSVQSSGMGGVVERSDMSAGFGGTR